MQIKGFVKCFTFLSLAVAASAAASSSKVEIYSPQDIQKMAAGMSTKPAGFASRNLPHYDNHYLMLAKRVQTGSSELHEHEADMFVVESGSGTLITGGTILKPHTEKPGEIRGSGIEGGDRHPIVAGDIVHIPANVPHQILVDKGPAFTYFVIKVTGQ